MLCPALFCCCCFVLFHAQDVPCLHEGIAALDGQQLLHLSERQLQGFFEAVLDSELQRAVHAARSASNQTADFKETGKAGWGYSYAVAVPVGCAS
jgi:hypothetical protein